MTAYRFVHLSDIHFGQERDGQIVIHSDVRDELVNDVSRMRERLGDADGVIVAGDAAYSGKRDEYQRATDWLERVAAAAGCRRTAVLVVPGNHDVDLTEIDLMARTVQAEARRLNGDDLQNYIVEACAIPDDRNPLLTKLRAYREFASQFGCDLTSGTQPSWTHDLAFDGRSGVRVHGLTSVLVSDRKDKLGELVLGNNQFIIPREEGIEHAVILHHPLAWFKDQVDISRYLLSRARLLIFGHEHRPAINKVVGEDGHEVIIIASGATNPPDVSGAYEYSYSWMEVEFAERAGAVHLVVRQFQQTWDRDSTEFRAKQKSSDLRGAVEMSAGCPHLALNKVLQGPPAVPIQGAGPNTRSLDAEAEVHRPSATESAMQISDDDRFRRLRYLFWRHLDWRQRIAVLAALDLIPPSADRPVPQTMERGALSAAEAHHMLHRVWAKVMEYVPAGSREDNPFKPNE